MKLIQPRAAVRVFSSSLLLNGGAEVGDASPLYWTSSGADATTDAVEVYTGSRSFKIVGGSDTWTSDYFNCDPETEHTARIYLKAVAATASFTIHYYDAVGVLLSSATIYSFIGTKAFTESLYRFTTPVGCYMMKAMLSCSAGTAYFDTMLVSEDFFSFHNNDLTNIEVVESQGRAKTTSLTLNNHYGKYSQDIQINYNIEIWFGCGANYKKKFAGVIASSPRSLNESGELMRIEAEHGDALFLYDRCNGEAYSAKTYEYIIKDLIPKHFDNITTNNVTAYGGSITKTFTQRETIQDALDYIAEQTGYLIYLDNDWDLHFESPTLTDSTRRVIQGDNIINYDIDYDKSLLCNCAGVYYDTGLTKYVEYEDRASIEDYNGRFKQTFDRDYYTTENGAKAFVKAYVEANSTLRLSGSVKVIDEWLSDLATAMTVILIVGNEQLNDDYEIKSIRLVLDETGYYSELEVMSIPTTITEFEVKRAPKKVQNTTVNHEKRLKKLEKTNVGVITESNIWKMLENELIKIDSIQLYAQGTGNSSVYGKAQYGTAKYAPQSATAWVLVRSASTSV